MESGIPWNRQFPLSLLPRTMRDEIDVVTPCQTRLSELRGGFFPCISNIRDGMGHGALVAGRTGFFRSVIQPLGFRPTRVCAPLAAQQKRAWAPASVNELAAASMRP